MARKKNEQRKKYKIKKITELSDKVHYFLMFFFKPSVLNKTQYFSK